MCKNMRVNVWLCDVFVRWSSTPCAHACVTFAHRKASMSLIRYAYVRIHMKMNEVNVWLCDVFVRWSSTPCAHACVTFATHEGIDITVCAYINIYESDVVNVWLCGCHDLYVCWSLTSRKEM